MIINDEEKFEALSPKIGHSHNAVYLGRSWVYPIALEGALKLKELSYIV